MIKKASLLEDACPWWQELTAAAFHIASARSREVRESEIRPSYDPEVSHYDALCPPDSDQVFKNMSLLGEYYLLKP